MSENDEAAAREVLAFEEFPKIPRLKREVVITEKVDGTNAQIHLVELNSPDLLHQATIDPFCLRIYPGIENGASAFALYAGSRSRWLDTSSKGDNFSFAKWVLENSDELYKLGPGRHYGEWYGLGIQRGYDLPNKRFALFNVARWNPENPNRPACCGVVPILTRTEVTSPPASRARKASLFITARVDRCTSAPSRKMEASGSVRSEQVLKAPH